MTRKFHFIIAFQTEKHTNIKTATAHPDTHIHTGHQRRIQKKMCGKIIMNSLLQYFFSPHTGTQSRVE